MSTDNTNERDVSFWPCLPDFPEQYRSMLDAGKNENDIFMDLANNDVFNPVRESFIYSYEELLDGLNDMRTDCDRFPSIFLIVDGKNYFSPDYKSWYSIDSNMENRKPVELAVLWNSDLLRMERLEKEIATLKISLEKKTEEYEMLRKKSR